MKFSDEIQTIVKAAAAKHGDEISKAVDNAVWRIRKLSDFKSMVDGLVRSAIQELVYDARHKMNIKIRQDMGSYGQPAKTITGASVAVAMASASLYSYYIDGTSLGSVQGSDLARIAESETAKADGCTFNAALATRLDKIVPNKKLVRDVVSEAKLKKIFMELRT